MPHRFPDLAPPQPDKSRTVALMQALPLGEVGLALFIALALMLT